MGRAIKVEPLDGNSAYDRYYGDPLCRPNPNLGTIEKGPFTAFQIVAGDPGTTSSSVSAPPLTEPSSRRTRAIKALYAAGNASASVMGNTYPGPGSTVGPAVVFGYRAARHASGQR